MSFWVSLQMRPVGDICNIACRYCVYGKAVGLTRMSDEVLRESIRKTLVNNQDGALFNWHGGEPTLAGVDFYRRAVEFQHRYAETDAVINTLQTNAVNLNSELVSFFKEHKFGIGVSLDGAEHLHDSVRVNKAQKGTYRDVVKGIGILRDGGVTPSVIATVSRESLPYAAETFRHLVELGFKNIHYSVVYDSKLEKDLRISNNEWYAYLKEVFHLWFALADPKLEVREVNEVVAWVAGASITSCTSRGTCAHWFSIDYNGDIYPCEVLGRDLHFGNILTHNFNDVLAGETHQRLVEFAAFRPVKCKSCEFLNLCNNGCTQMRDDGGESNRLGLYAYCGERLTLFEEIKKTFGV